MPNYTEFMMRHGEHGVQTIIEQIERIEGIRAAASKSLEDRWEVLLSQATEQRLAA